jgi:hypothetical protein
MSAYFGLDSRECKCLEYYIYTYLYIEYLISDFDIFICTFYHG